ncbi:MAG: hypothetical protein ACI8UZ_003118, partial [Akkermansiaceae bacterium]
DDGMAGIISALAAYDKVRFFGEKIDDLAFSFVAPLEAANDGIH